MKGAITGGDRRPKLTIGRAPSVMALSSPGGCDDEDRGSLAPYFPAVVQVFTSSVANDWDMPWSRDRPEKSTGSGWILQDRDTRFIVTNAHVVEFASTLQVRRESDPTKYEATVVVVAHQVDLALLTVSKAGFWREAIALELGPDPRIQQSVHVIGYPLGGENLSITGGVVSRVDWSAYAQSKKSNLIVQVDAAINAGNSGGPALTGGRVCGVAFQALDEADNVGYIVPAGIVRRLVEDVRAAGAAPERIRGFAEFAVPFQRAENDALRASVGVPEGVSGVILGSPPAMSNLAAVVSPNDLLAEVDGLPVSNDGRIRMGDSSALDFRAAFTLKLVGEPVALVLYRGSEKREVVVEAERVPELVPSTWFARPSYVLVAGLVFVPMHLHDQDGEMSPFFLAFVEGSMKHEFATDQVVVLNGSALPHAVTLGYDDADFDHLPLLSIDGARIRNLADVAAAVQAARGPTVKFSFAMDRVIVLPLDAGRAATAELMKEFGIAAPWSPDITAELARRKAPAAAAAAAAAAGAAGGPPGGASETHGPSRAVGHPSHGAGRGHGHYVIPSAAAAAPVGVAQVAHVEATGAAASAADGAE